VFNLRVEHDHTYFAAAHGLTGEESLWVHNAGADYGGRADCSRKRRIPLGPMGRRSGALNKSRRSAMMGSPGRMTSWPP
jgi:hypothetical protein